MGWNQRIQLSNYILLATKNKTSEILKITRTDQSLGIMTLIIIVLWLLNSRPTIVVAAAVVPVPDLQAVAASLNRGRTLESISPAPRGLDGPRIEMSEKKAKLEHPSQTYDWLLCGLASAGVIELPFIIKSSPVICPVCWEASFV